MKCYSVILLHSVISGMLVCLNNDLFTRSLHYIPRILDFVWRQTNYNSQLWIPPTQQTMPGWVLVYICRDFRQCCNLMNVHFIKCLNELSNSAHLMCQNNSSPVHLAAFFRQKPITWTISTNLENVIQTQWEPKLIWGLKGGRTIIHSLEIFFI